MTVKSSELATNHCLPQWGATKASMLCTSRQASQLSPLFTQVHLKSDPLQHFFDCPFQFGAYPDFVDATDDADQATAYNVHMQPNDVIIAGSDGLWDNVFDSELLQLLPKSTDKVRQHKPCHAALCSWQRIGTQPCALLQAADDEGLRGVLRHSWHHYSLQSGLQSKQTWGRWMGTY